MVRIESLLSARLFLVPQQVEDRIYFLSNLSGRLSLYTMYYGGSVPEPLLPPHIALQNPHLIIFHSFYVFPNLGKILVMIDQDGNERYQPMLIPLDGGFPEPAFGNFFANHRVFLVACDIENNIVYFDANCLDKPLSECYRGNLAANSLVKLDESPYGAFPMAFSPDHNQVILADGYAMGDRVLFLWQNGKKELLFGTPLQERKSGEEVPPNGITSVAFSPSTRGILMVSAIFQDTYSLGYLGFSEPSKPYPVNLEGLLHSGVGELSAIEHLRGTHYAVTFNIDGCSWVYEGYFNEDKRSMSPRHVICGDGDLSNGVLERSSYDKSGDRFVLSFSSATSPTQLYTVEGKSRDLIVMHTNEKVLGITEGMLSRGEDASFVSFDGTRISARLYLPSAALDFQSPCPVVYYVHGGPQSQERPDFAWFSMPLIQFLTLHGFAVFVPNVRGSSGYGLSYTKQVDRDWGGKDRLDHFHAMTQVLPRDKRLDVRRAAVVGRSYGGYMTLMLAGQYPELWKAACDMFGPYDLITFLERIPETWKPYYALALGDPAKPEDREFLRERSPRTYIENLGCPMLVIQGKNDPRVVEAESHDLIEHLRSKGKEIEYLVFPDEGHDVLKYENRVICYNAITDFFARYLKP